MMHYAKQADITREELGEHPDIIYTDPPWGAGNLKYWRTMNGEREKDFRPSWEEFKLILAAICEKAKKHVFIEMGMRWRDEVVALISDSIPHIQSYTVMYGKPAKPLSLNYFSRCPVELPVMNGWHDEKYTWNSLAAVGVDDAVVLDPCCGLGMTARFSIAIGMVFHGYELNEKRLAKTQEWIAKVSKNPGEYRRKWQVKYGIS